MTGPQLSIRNILAVCVLATMGCGSPGGADMEWSMDQRSYNLGAVGAFAEMVGAGVKELALSAPLEPMEMDVFLPLAAEIAARHQVNVYRESDFLVTDLFASNLTDGLDVLLIYRGETLERYNTLKREKTEMLRAGTYEGVPRNEVARLFGKMLSYTDQRVSELLSANQ